MVVSCPRVCLLVVSRLLVFTLRHVAPVCSCHRDSLTRWAGNCARSRACAVLHSLLDWFLHVMTCVWWFLTAYEEGLFRRRWNLKVLRPSFLVLYTFLPSMPLAYFSTVYPGYAWARSICVTSWCPQCTSPGSFENQSCELPSH